MNTYSNCLLAVTVLLLIGFLIIPMTFGQDIPVTDEDADDWAFCCRTDYNGVKKIDIPDDFYRKLPGNGKETPDSMKPNSLFLDEPMNSPWPMQSHDSYHTGRSPYNTAHNPGLIRWQYEIDSMEGGIVIDENDTLYFGDLGWNFYAVYPNGTLKWYYGPGGIIWSTPAIAENGTIYIGSWSNHLHAINPNGTRKWRFDASGSISSSPAIGEDGTIYFGTLWSLGSGGKIHAVNPDGTEKWHYQTGYHIRSAPAIADDGTIYIGSGDGYLYAMNPNGTLKWRFETGYEIHGNPSIAEDGTIYISSWDDFLYAIYPNGTERWRVNTGFGTSGGLAIDPEGTIYLGSGNVYAIYPNGTIKWVFDLENQFVDKSSPALSADGIIYIGTEIGDSEGGNIIAINPDGTERWREQIAEYTCNSAPSIAEDGTIYIGCTQDTPYLYSFGNDDFWADAHGPYEGLVNEEIQFLGDAYNGIEPYTWHWDFGNGDTSEEQNPVYTYTTPDEYTVTLTVTDDSGNQTNDTTTATIYGETSLAIDISRNSIIITNDGEYKAYDIDWTIDITGGIFGLIDEHLEGFEEFLEAGDEIVVDLPFLFGFGSLDIEATAAAINAETVTEQETGLIVLFFVFIS